MYQNQIHAQLLKGITFSLLTPYSSIKALTFYMYRIFNLIYFYGICNRYVFFSIHVSEKEKIEKIMGWPDSSRKIAAEVKVRSNHQGYWPVTNPMQKIYSKLGKVISQSESPFSSKKKLLENAANYHEMVQWPKLQRKLGMRL